MECVKAQKTQVAQMAQEGSQGIDIWWPSDRAYCDDDHICEQRPYIQKIWVALLNRVGYTPEISHGVLDEMAEHRKDLEKKTKPILDTLRSYQDLPPDKALAALAIEDKKMQYAAAEKRLEDVLQSALATSE
ncbi:AUGMIN subunit 1 [Vitis vinifera]|uniref:AUGMIN subunit 1 n=1 Tax=Vitis vinifera TaxID=29760 RepID=A0A438JC78_VITVI|nr:AUGMIN subunit 1 [Vitis vinifera]